MLTVACVKQGSKYGPEYAERLHKAVERHLSLPHRFVCFTDEDVPGVPCEPLPAPLIGWWSKIGMFRKGVFPKGDRVLYFDLGTLIVASIDDMAAYDGQFAILRDFYRPHGLQSSVMAWSARACIEVWNKWWKAGCPQLQGGDQAWMEMVKPGAEILQDLYPGRLVSFKVHCKLGVPEGASVVKFHGYPRLDECRGWVQEKWLNQNQEKI